MSWERSTRSARLPSNWKQIRLAILDRDHWRCTVIGCRTPYEQLEVDHIIPNDDHSPHNLQTLCHSHHKAKTTEEAANARRQKNARRFHPVEQHPGVATD